MYVVVTARKLLSQVEKSLSQEAEIRSSRPGISIISKYIDEVTTKEVVRGALKN